jgi:hypothetical protein
VQLDQVLALQTPELALLPHSTSQFLVATLAQLARQVQLDPQTYLAFPAQQLAQLDLAHL